jgi:hypothetical protein
MLANHALAAEKQEPGLLGEYYALDDSLEDFPSIGADKKPALKRVDKTINIESTTEALPGTQLVDHFYIRWTGKLRVPKDGTYTFFLESDDGSRLFIDGKQVVDNGGLHAMEEKEGQTELKAGDHALKVEFFENEVDAGCKFSWQPPGKDKEIVPSSVLFTEAAASEPAPEAAGKSGLSGEYYALDDALEDFPSIAADKKPTLKRVDQTINIESTTEALPGTQLVDHFYIRWTGSLQIPKDGTYTFFLESDDGSRLFIDGKEVVDNGGLHAMEEKSGVVELKAGNHPLKVEFFENEVDAGCKFSWQPPGKDKEVVPSSVLSH